MDLLECVSQEEADFATVVPRFALAQVALGSVQLWFNLPDARHLLLLLAVEIRAGELVSHGLGPKQTHKSLEGNIKHTHKHR